MAYVDTGEDELDYEGEDFVDRDAFVLGSPRSGEEIGALAEEDLEEDDYEDLYHDVNVGFYSGVAPEQGLAKSKEVNGGEERFEKEGDDGLVEDQTGGSRGAEKVYREKDERQLGLGDVSEGGCATRTIVSLKDSTGKSDGKTLSQSSKGGCAAQNSNADVEQINGRLGEQTETDKYEDLNSSKARIKGTDAEAPGSKSSETKGAVAVDASRVQRTLYEENEYTEDELVVVSEEGRASSDAAGVALMSTGAGSASNTGRAARAGSPTKARLSPPLTTGNHDSGPSRQGGTAPVNDGKTSVFVGDLQWWTTDAELEAALLEYGRIKNIRYFEERASGKFKGYCLVEFYDSAAAHLCKEKMEGKLFNGRPCIIAFPSHRNQTQLNVAPVSRNPGPPPSVQGAPGHGAVKKTVDRGGIIGRGGGSGSQSGNSGRSGYSKMGMGQASGMGGGRGQAPGRGRGRAMGSNGPYSQGHLGPMGGPGAAGMMAAPGMMGQGYDAGFGPPMGRQNMGSMGYGMAPAGGFVPRAPYPSMGPPYPGVGPGLPGVAPHVNPAFFGRGSNGSAMGKMGGAMNGSFRGWDGSMSGWGGDENERWMREGDFGDEMGTGEYGHGAEISGERGRSVQSRDRNKGIEGDWVDWRRKGTKDADWEREKHMEWDGYNEQQEGDWDGEMERSQRIRSRSRVAEEDDSARYREDDHGKKRRYGGDR